MEHKLYRIFEAPENQSPFFWSIVGVLTVGLLSVVDYLTGTRINIALFYLAPIALVAWAVSQSAGLWLSLVSALSWLAAGFPGAMEDPLSVYIWNTLIHAGFFVIVAGLVSGLQKSYRKEQQAARTDFLTGATNRRHFYELVQTELDRLQRYDHPFTVVYIDLDNFKQMNDQFGHELGDEVLRTITHQLKTLLRRTDIVARLGGDEFAVLLPFASQSGAEAAVGRVHAHLKATVRQKNWPVSVSMGAVTCAAPPSSLKHLIAMADDLMYEVKKSTKNNARFMTWEGSQNVQAPLNLRRSVI